MKAFSNVLCHFVLVIFTLKAASAFNCFQCNSNEHGHCTETFNKEHLEIQSTPCDGIHEAKYCVKTIGIYGGIIGTTRFCSSRHHGNHCEYVRRKGDDRDYRSCVFTCYRDGCNGSSGIAASILSLSVLVLSLIVLRYI